MKKFMHFFWMLIGLAGSLAIVYGLIFDHIWIIRAGFISLVLALVTDIAICDDDGELNY